MNSTYIDGLTIVKKELYKLKDKYEKKIEKEKEKGKYITIQGEKCYTEDDIRDMYEGDCFDSRAYDRYLDKLQKVLHQDIHGKSKYEYAKDAIDWLLKDIATEIYEERNQIEEQIGGKE